MAGRKIIKSSLPLGPSFPGGPYEKGVEKSVDAAIIKDTIIKALIQSGDIVVIDASLRQNKEVSDLEKQMEELKNQLKEAQEKLESIKPVEKVTESKIEAKNLVTSVDKVSASTSKVKKNKTSEVTTKVSLGKIDKL